MTPQKSPPQVVRANGNGKPAFVTANGKTQVVDWAEFLGGISRGKTVLESVKTSTTLSPTESEIASLAYQLWQDNGCPVGSDQEDWCLAKAMLRNALVAKCKDLSGGPLVPCGVTRTEPEMPAELQWKGCWVVWESEWGGPRWVRDLATPGFEALSRAA